MKKLTFLILLLPVLLNAQPVIVLDVTQPTEFNFETTRLDTAIVSGDSVRIGTAINIFGGSGEYIYSWNPAEFLADSTQLTPIAFPTDTTEYILTVTDANGCSFTTSFIVNVVENTTDIQGKILPDDFLTATLYPNPNNGQFTVELSGKYKGAIELTVFDNLGRTVYQKTIQHFRRTHLESINAKFPKGIYNLLVHSREQKLQKRFVVQ